MKKSFKSGLAVLLAVLMVLTTGLYSADGFLRATDGDSSQTEEQSAADDQNADAAKVHEETELVLPDQGTADSDTTQAATPAEAEKQQAAGTADSSDSSSDVQKSASSGTDSDKDDDAAAKETTYDVAIEEPSQDGGDVYVWTDGSAKEEVAYTGGSYIKSVKDGDTFNMEITAKDGYSVEKVTANGSQISAAAVSGNVYTYKINVNANKKLTISYKKTSSDSAQNDANKDEDSDDTEDGEPAASTKANFSLRSAAVLSDEEEGDVEIFDFRVYFYSEAGVLLDTKAVEVESGVEGTIAVPEKNGYKAYIADNDGNPTGDPITEVTRTITETTEVEVVYIANTVDVTVNHVFPGSKGTIEETIQGKVGQTTTVQPKTVAGYIAKYYSQQAITPDGATVTINYAYVTSQITFESNGGSFVDPIEVNVDSVTAINQTPTKVGYTFGGWYANEDLSGSKVTELKNVTSNITLYAKWTAKEVNYTVNYWKQKVIDPVDAADADKTYDFAESTMKTALVGTKVSGSSAGKSYKGFDFGRADQNVEVKADGTTVINIYYNRKVCTVNFYLYTSFRWKVDSTHQGLYGASFTNWRTDYSWYSKKSNGTGCVLLTSYDFAKAGYANNENNKTAADGTVITCNFYGKSENNNNKIYYYNEKYDGTFELVQSLTTMGTGLNIHEKYEGYDLYKYTNDTSGDKTTATYWARKTNCVDGTVSDKSPTYVASVLKRHVLTYYNYNSVAKTENIKYTTPLGSYGNYTPERPDDLPSYYVFQGWYLDPACTKIVEWDKLTMPNANLQVYAKWAKAEYTVTVNTNNGVEAVTIPNVEGGSTLTKEQLPDPTRDGYNFKGWYLDSACTQPYSLSKPIISDITIYAKWEEIKDVTFTIKYVDADNPNKDDIIDPVTQQAEYGIDVTVSAIDIEGYYLVGEPYQTLKLDKDSSNNIITFEYRHVIDGYYRVQYVVDNGNGQYSPISAATDPVSNNKKPSVRYTATPPAGYTCDKYIYITNFGPANNVPITPIICKPITVTIKTNTFSDTYDGNEHHATFAISGLPAGYRATATCNTNYVNAGEYTHKWCGGDELIVTAPDGTDVTNIINKEYVSGKIIINKRSVTLTSASATKEYDGTPLTKDGVTVGGDGFVNGEGATYNVTGSQLIAGRSENSFTYTLNNGTKADNYNITQVYGTLNVTDRTTKYEITVEANSDSVKYDGAKHTVSGFKTLEFTVSGQKFTVSGLSASAKGTDAGTYTVAVSGTPVVKDASGNDVTSQFTVKTQSGSLTISKRSVTLTSASATKEYDGTPLTNSNVSVTGDGFAAGEGAAYNVTGSQLIAGSSANSFTYTLKNGTNADNYIITKSEGTLTVTNREAKYEITVVANSKTEKYDGIEKSVSGFETLEFIVNGQHYTVEGFTASAAGTNAGEYTANVTGTAVVKDAAGNDVTAQFAVKTESGKLTIEKRNVILTSATASKPYDGTPLTNSNVSVTGDGFAAGEGADYNVTGSQLIAGSSQNYFTYALKSGTSIDNYNITTKNGTLTVTNREAKYEITVKANSDTMKYDGTAKTVSGFETQEFTVNEQKYTVEGLTASAEGTNAGEYTVNVEGTAVVKDALGNDVTAQFAVKTESGKLTIEKRNVTLTSATDEKEYDGIALTNGTVTVSGDGFVTGEGATYNVTGSQLIKGSSANTFSYTLNEGTKADNYNITAIEGTLTVKDRTEKYAIEVVANSGNDKYDGTEKSVSGFATLTFVKNGVTYTVEGLTASATGTDAGEYVVNVTGTPVVKDAAGHDVTAQFAVTSKNGKLTINKREVTLTSATDSKEYDGNPLTNDEVTVSGDGFIDGEGATYNVTGSQLIAGSSANSFTYTLKSGTKSRNYTITKSEGTLTVTNRVAKYEITVVANSGTEKYDGVEKSVSGFKTLEFTVNGHKYTVSGFTAEAKGTNAGTYPVNVVGTPVVKDAAGNDVTGQFKVNTTNGSLVISKRVLTITSNDATKEYDGKPLTKHEVTVSGDGFADGEGATYAYTGTQTIAGSSENKFTYTLNEGTNADNYTITTNNGTLTVTNRAAKYQITVEANSGTFKYDGTEKSVSGFKTLEFTVNGQQYTVSGLTAKATATDAGEYTVNVTGTPVVNDAAGNDVTAQFAVTPKNGTLTISKRNVTLTSASDTKEYDGDPLTNGEVTVSGDGFADGEGATYNVTGTRTIAGSSANSFTYTLNTGTKAENYNITKTEGTLTVTNRNAKYEITVVANSKTEKYDGTEKSVSGFETLTFTVNGKTYTVSGLTAEAKGTDVAADGYATTITGTPVVNDSQGNDVSAQFAVSTQNGRLNITPRTITLVSASDQKTYDETPLTNHNVTVNTKVGDDFADGEGATYTVTGSQTLVGESDNTFSYTFNDNTKAINYTILLVPGLLKVTDDVAANKVINKTHEEGEYALGDTVTFTITVTNIYDTPKTITIVEKAGVTITGQSVFENVPAGETRTTTATYVITEDDILAGGFTNDVTAKFTGGKDFSNTDDVDVEDSAGHLTVTKTTTSTPANGETYALGETISYKVTVTNDGNLTIKDITVTDELTGNVGDKAWTIDKLAPGASEEFTAEYIVTEADILAGSVVNEATATGTSPDPDEPEVPVTPGEKEDPTEEPAGHLTVTKETTSTPEEGNSYGLGETISYKVTVTNDGNLTIKDITVTDELTGNVGDKAWTIDKLAPGESEEFTAEYTVTETDILAGKVVNNATATGTSPDPDEPEVPVTPGEKEDPTEVAAPSLYIEKIADKNPSQVKLGDIINYTITVKNNGNVTIKNVKVTDDLTKDEETYDALKPGETKELKVSYTVTEDDLLKGKVTNVATVTGTDPNGNSIEETDTVNVTTEDPVGKLKVTKTTTSKPANGETYALGEEITYEITVENTGNLTVSDITVTDELTGNVGNDAWKIDSLAPGEKSTPFEAKYTVTEDDILAGEVANEATAAGTTKNNDNPEATDKITDQTVEANGHLTVTKETTSTPANGKTYALGETIAYKVTVTNDGNLTITDITVTDELTNDEWSINSLAPGKSESFDATYTVTEDDIKAGKVVNVATAEGTSPDTEKPDVPVEPGEKEDPTDPVDATYDVDKTIVNPQKEYKVGDKIKYQIKVTNPGNVTIENITITDQLQNAAGKVTFTDLAGAKLNSNNTVTIDKIEPNGEVVLKCEYRVVRADAGKQIVNIAIAKSDTEIPDPEDPEKPPIKPGDQKDPTDPAPVEKMYTLTIHYVYANGDTAAKDYTGKYLAGEAYGPIYSPTINGYTTEDNYVRSGKGGMPPKDTVIYVVYTAVPANGGGNGGGTPATTPNTGLAVQADDDGNVNVTPVVDDKVPLARQNLDDHDCCILHFLLMLLALIALICYTVDMKKRQERIAELKDELETEQIKRSGLGR